ncbi:MAG: sigma-70 family RNA polymerase sigma factor [Pirellulales bacterium]|nr:sigma-70 family RNA polymerase sigma factor [Pirellulales bacterium]
MFVRNEELEMCLGVLFVRATKYDDTAAMEAVMDYCLPALTECVSRWCDKKGRSRGFAEIVASVTLMKALAKADSFDSEKPLMPWLKMIARRELIDLHRVEERLDRRFNSLDRMTQLPSHDENELTKLHGREIAEAGDELVRREDEAERERTKQVLRNAILSLPALKCKLIEAYCAEKSIGAIAVEFKLTRSQVHKILFDAKAQLRRRIA